MGQYTYEVPVETQMGTPAVDISTEARVAAQQIVDTPRVEASEPQENFFRRHKRLTKAVSAITVAAGLGYGVSEVLKASAKNVAEGIGSVAGPVEGVVEAVGEVADKVLPSRRIEIETETFKSMGQDAGKLVGYEQTYSVEVEIEDSIDMGWPLREVIDDQRFGATLEGRGSGAFYVDLNNPAFDIRKETREDTIEINDEEHTQKVEYLLVTLPEAEAGYTNVHDPGEIDQYQSALFDFMETAENTAGWVPFVGGKLKQANENVENALEQVYTVADMQLKNTVNSDEHGKEEAMESVQAKLREMFTQVGEIDSDQIVFEVVTEADKSQNQAVETAPGQSSGE